MATSPAAVTPTRATSPSDLLVVGAGTGMAAALAAKELGLAPSSSRREVRWRIDGTFGGAFWLPDNPILREANAGDSTSGRRPTSAPSSAAPHPPNRQAFVDNSAATVETAAAHDADEFFWAEGYSDYHPELPVGSAIACTCECRPFDASILGPERP
ncbi:FAD-binding protein, partial [Rhodococcus hoagii]|nr:FAD-binding protein [Prescottella equi]